MLRLLALGLIGVSGCALSHQRAEVDGGPIADAASDARTDPGIDASFDAAVDPCAMGRSELVITPPRARRRGHTIRLLGPHVSARGDRFAVSALVFSDRAGGIGNSDILAYDVAGGSPSAFFSTDLPYELGSSADLSEYLAFGGLAAGRVYGQIQRFDTRWSAAPESSRRSTCSSPSIQRAATASWTPPT